MSGGWLGRLDQTGVGLATVAVVLAAFQLGAGRWLLRQRLRS